MRNSNYARFSSILLAAFAVGCTSFEPDMRLERTAQALVVEAPFAPGVRPITSALNSRLRTQQTSRICHSTDQFIGTTKPCILGSGNLLSVLVWNHPELNIPAAGARSLSSWKTQAISSLDAQMHFAYVVDQAGAAMATSYYYNVSTTR